MDALEGRVAIVTGAGRGLGREHALFMASEGARVVVNDLGGGVDGTGADAGPARNTVSDILALGGEAVVNTDDVTDSDGAKRLVDQAVEAFGALHVLVNNAGILRDRRLVNMTEEEWDAVIGVHLRGHYAPSRWAAAYWREQSKAGRDLKASVINTSSTSGLLGNIGQTNYASAKAGIAAFTLVSAMELMQYGVRCNAIAPYARTRMTLETPGLGDLVAAPDDPARFDVWDPANVSPLVAYLATEDCPFNGAVFHTGGSEIGLYQGWTLLDVVQAEDRWTVEELAEAAPGLLENRPALASIGTSTEEMGMQFMSRQLG